MNITESTRDWHDLKRAIALLESPTITARMADFIGAPLEGAVKVLPLSVSKKIQGAVQIALYKAADAALWSMRNTPGAPASTKRHKMAAAATGAVGGAFGFAALFLELPLSTTIMMRSVADVARSEGFDLNEYSTKHACLEVFALGGRTDNDDASEIGYYVVRGFSADAMRHMSKELAQIAAKNAGGLAPAITSKQTGKWLASLIEKIATRFGVVITEKFAAQAVPVIGALTGAALNTMFTDYYQDMARGHFIVKRLEAKYGEAYVESIYRQQIVESQKALPAPKR